MPRRGRPVRDEAPSPTITQSGEKALKGLLSEHEVLIGLARIASDESAPITARVSAYGMLGKHYGLFTGDGAPGRSDLEALLDEIAERNSRALRTDDTTDMHKGHTDEE